MYIKSFWQAWYESPVSTSKCESNIDTQCVQEFFFFLGGGGSCKEKGENKRMFVRGNSQVTSFLG